MIYTNIEVDNGIRKAPILRRLFHDFNWDSLIILGAQDHDDVRSLCKCALIKNLEIILIDIRKNELDKHRKIPSQRIVADLSCLVYTKKLIDQLSKRFKNPFIYDNLCGGRSRDMHIHLFLDSFPSLISYISGRNSRLREIRPYILSKVQYNRTNYIVHLSKSLG